MSSGRRKLKTQSLSQNTGASTSKQSVTNQSTHTNEELDEIDKNVIKCVRYFVLKVGPQQIVHKAELQKTVLYHFGKNFAKIMDKTAEHLRNVFGLELISYNDRKQYTLSNKLPYLEGTIHDVNKNGIPEDAHKVYLLLILTHIFMSNDSVSEASLENFFKSLKINLEENNKTFGCLKKYLCDITKQKYLSIEKNATSNKVYYHWGPKAESEVSKRKIVNFVCKIYGDKIPENWKQQYANAIQQFKEDKRAEESQEVDMEVDI